MALISTRSRRVPFGWMLSASATGAGAPAARTGDPDAATLEQTWSGPVSPSPSTPTALTVICTPPYLECGSGCGQLALNW